MQTWIFQGNPDDYDIDAYLASRPAQVSWLVTRYAAEVAVGDRVYLWRNQGSRKAIAGIVAECIVNEATEIRSEDPEGVQFWRAGDERSSRPQPRALLRLLKVASAREVIQGRWCEEDPVLADLPNLKMRNATNYKISALHAARIASLWNRTGKDWNRSESIAGLWAYAETFGGPVSSLPESPVSHVALLVGRAVSGSYAKVMNFRSLDPRTDSGQPPLSGPPAMLVARPIANPLCQLGL